MHSFRAVVFVFCCGFVLESFAKDSSDDDPGWPEYRGPAADGHSPSRGLPLEWSESKNVRWKTAIHGRGWSTPVVRGKQVWITTATEDGKEMSILCVDRDSGDIVHDRVLFRNESPRPLGNDMNGYASPSCVVEDGAVYAHFGSYGTARIDTETFETQWTQRDLPCHHFRGPASSPILVDGRIILHMDGADHQYIVALDKKSGDTVWRTERSTDYGDLDASGKPKRDGDFRKAYNTPVVRVRDGVPVVVSPAAKAVYGYDARTGDELWQVRYPGHSTASRTVLHGNLALVNTGYSKAELWAIELGGKGDVTDSHVRWKRFRSVPNRASPVLVDGHYYSVSDKGVGLCLNASTGDEIWTGAHRRELRCVAGFRRRPDLLLQHGGEDHGHRAGAEARSARDPRAGRRIHGVAGGRRARVLSAHSNAPVPHRGFETVCRGELTMLEKPYRVAVIGRTGKGNYGHGLDRVWLEVDGARVVAVADDDPTGLANAAKRLSCKPYADYREMLRKERPQIVSVAPRWLDAHRGMVEACADHGASVFLEKPMCRDLEEADAMVSACERSHVKLAIAHQTRYSPTVRVIRQLIEAGEIGELLEFRGRGKEDSRRGGGEDLWVLGTHIFDLMRLFCGDPTWCFAASDAGRAADPQGGRRPGQRGDRSAGGRRARSDVRAEERRDGLFLESPRRRRFAESIRTLHLRLEGRDQSAQHRVPARREAAEGLVLVSGPIGSPVARRFECRSREARASREHGAPRRKPARGQGPDPKYRGRSRAARQRLRRESRDGDDRGRVRIGATGWAGVVSARESKEPVVALLTSIVRLVVGFTRGRFGDASDRRRLEVACWYCGCDRDRRCRDAPDQQGHRQATVARLRGAPVVSRASRFDIEPAHDLVGIGGSPVRLGRSRRRRWRLAFAAARRRGKRFESSGELDGLGPASVRLSCERAIEDVLEAVRGFDAEARESRWIPEEFLRDRLGDRLAVVGRTSRERCEEDAAQAVDVGAHVGGSCVLRLLGGDVVGRAHDVGCPGEGGLTDGLAESRQSEIEDANSPRGRRARASEDEISGF